MAGTLKKSCANSLGYSNKKEGKFFKSRLIHKLFDRQGPESNVLFVYSFKCFMIFVSFAFLYGSFLNCIEGNVSQQCSVFPPFSPSNAWKRLDFLRL